MLSKYDQTYMLNALSFAQEITKLHFHTLILSTLILVSACSADNPDVVFGAIADCQYADKEDKGKRRYRSCPKKLQQSIEKMNNQNVDFAIHLGDFIDKDIKSLDTLLPLTKKLTPHLYHVLGNHDYAIADSEKKTIPKKLNMPSRYYTFLKSGWKFIVLDGNDISFRRHHKGSPQRQEVKQYYNQIKPKPKRYNGAIGNNQLSWLDAELKLAQKENRPVIIFCHFPIYPNNIHNLWNSQQLRNLLEQYSGVKAYFNGHNHNGNYGKLNGIHYITLKSMVDTDENSYSFVSLSAGQIKVTGFGRAESYILTIQ